MNVEILSPDKHLFKGAADLVTLPGTNGSFQIKNSHAPLISSLNAGHISVQNGSETTTFDIKGGLVEVKQNEVIILV
jgi:F-type H+-transporting ATPase subunit epsilon